MSRLCVPGLLALLAAAALTWPAEAQLRKRVVLPTADDEEKEDRKLSDDEQKALEVFIKKAVEAKKKLLDTEMKAAAAEVTKELKLERDAEKKLAALTAKTVEAALPAWEQAFRKYIQPQAEQSTTGVKDIESWSAESHSRNVTLDGVPPPQETEIWKNGLKEVLTPEQWAARETVATAAEKKFQEDFGDYLATCEGQAGDQMAAAMESEVQRIFQFSGMDEERRKKLKAAGDDAVKECVKAWRRKMENQLKSMEQKQREQMTSRGGMMNVNMTEKEYQPKERAVWKAAFASLLNEEERKTLEARYQEVRGRRADALALILVNDLDRLAGFSAEQRTKFLPLAAQRLLKLPDYYFTAPESGGYYSLDSGQMLQLVQKIKEEELKAIFSESQVKRFREASPDQMSRSGSSYIREKLDVGEVPKPEEMDEVEVERILARYLHREAKKMKLKMLSIMEAQVEHIGRVTNPAPDKVKVLTTAAKGAAEEMAQANINNLSSWVRGQFQSVKPADVPARLQNLQNPYFSDRNQTPLPPALWTAAVARLLDESQRQAWKTEMDAREKWRREGLSAIVITDLEKRIVMPEEQRTKLAKKVDAVIEQYEPDFTNYFSVGWHLQGYYSLIPIAMFTEKEMAEHFDKQQIECMKDKMLTNSLQYAEMIRQNHKSRTGK